MNYPEAAQLFSIGELMAFLQSTSSVYAEKCIGVVPVLWTYPPSKLHEAGASYGLSIDKFSSNVLFTFLEWRKDGVEWMNDSNLNQVCMDTKATCFQDPSPAHAEAAVYRQAVSGTGLAWRLFLCSWSEKNWSHILRSPLERQQLIAKYKNSFKCLNHISSVAQHNSSNLCSCQFWHLIWFYEPCCPSTNRFVLLTWKWVFPSIKA